MLLTGHTRLPSYHTTGRPQRWPTAQRVVAVMPVQVQSSTAPCSRRHVRRLDVGFMLLLACGATCLGCGLRGRQPPRTNLSDVLVGCTMQVVAHAAPFESEDYSVNSSDRFSSPAQSSSEEAHSELPDSPRSTRPSSKSNNRSSSQPSTPRPLTPSTAQQLERHLLQLLPRPPVSTPLAPLLAVLLPLLQARLAGLPPAGLLGVLRLCNWAGAGHSPSTAWLQDWAAALHQQMPNLQSEAACCLVSEVLRLWQAQLPAAVLDDLFVAVLKDPGSCSSSSITAALAGVAVAELRHGSGPASSPATGSTQQLQRQANNTALSSSSSSNSGMSSASNVMLAAWRSNYHSSSSSSSSGRSCPNVSSSSQLYPLVLQCLLEEVGSSDRLVQLQPNEVAAVAAAAAALQLRLPAGWLDRWAAISSCSLFTGYYAFGHCWCVLLLFFAAVPAMWGCAAT